jgi:hypothetical protein
MTPPGATPVASITINALDPGRPVRHAGITETACDHRHRRTREREDTPERDHVGDAATRGDGRHALRGRSTGSSTRLSVRADDQIIEVLAPDGLGRAARTAGKLETIQIRGGTQALERNEVHSRPEDQREDMITLLALVEDPDAMVRSSRNQSDGGCQASRPHSRSTTPCCLRASRTQTRRGCGWGSCWRCAGATSTSRAARSGSAPATTRGTSRHRSQARCARFPGARCRLGARAVWPPRKLGRRRRSGVRG